jgi:hypothetical protein
VLVRAKVFQRLHIAAGVMEKVRCTLSPVRPNNRRSGKKISPENVSGRDDTASF